MKRISLNQLIDAEIIAHDGQFLGIISQSRFEPNSIANEFGEFGNRFRPNSIFNELGRYGSRLSPLSPFNRMSQTPPRIMREGVFIAFLTRNSMISPAVDSNDLLKWIGR